MVRGVFALGKPVEGVRRKKRNGCEGGNRRVRQPHPKPTQKAWRFEVLSSYISLSVSQECCLCPREREEEKGEQPPYSYTHYTGEREKSFVPIHHMHRELCIMGCHWLSNWFSFFSRILKQLPPQFLHFILFF
jgi:hypothetical protein